MALLVVSVVCYIATFSFSGLLFHWFTPSGHDCGLNLFFIVFTLILVFAFAIIALHPKVSSCASFLRFTDSARIYHSCLYHDKSYTNLFVHLYVCYSRYSLHLFDLK